MSFTIESRREPPLVFRGPLRVARARGLLLVRRLLPLLGGFLLRLLGGLLGRLLAFLSHLSHLLSVDLYKQ